MRKIFADAGYFVAILNPRDQLHDRAAMVSEQLGTFYLVTSELVLAETLNGLADKGAEIRLAAVQTVLAIRSQVSAKIVPQTSSQFSKAFDLYRTRPDKDWGLIDCSSFLIMKDEGIKEALTPDRHFFQAGFKALLRDE